MPAETSHANDRHLQRDLLALVFLAFNAFLIVSLLTANPADSAGALVYPAAESFHNACGRLGALMSGFLLEGFGLGAYFVAASALVLNIILLMRRSVTEPNLRLVGWLLTLWGLCTLAALAMPNLSPGSVIGPGGYLGAAGRGVLEMFFARAGAFILVASAIVGGLLLCTDYALLQVTGWLLRATTAGTGKMLGALRRHREEEASDEAETEELRISGRRRRRVRASEEADADSDAEAESGATNAKINIRAPQKEEAAEEEEQPAEEEAVTTSIAKKIAGAIRVRNPRSKNSEREAVLKELEEAARRDDDAEYELPPLDLLVDAEPFSYEQQEQEVRQKAAQLEATFQNFGLNVKVVEVETGPVIAQYEVELEPGLRLSKITSLADDLAVALRVPSVRVVAPIPGKNTVGIEVPNSQRQLVRLREVMEQSPDACEKHRIPVFLGYDVSGNPMVVDLTTLPHLLIAGRTGTGKSVCLNTIIMSILMTRRPDEVKMLLIDPKMVELTPYSRLPHLMHPVVTDMKKAEAILAWAVDKMEERYNLLMRAGVRHMAVYNQLGAEEIYERLAPETEEEKAAIPTHLPYIVIVADEMADLMMTAPKEVESHIIRLAQKSRAVGIHLILATQKPTVDVITGLIKSNLPARIAFQVASRVDSRVVLDEQGADKLLGNGDMLFLWPGTSLLLRGQGAYVSDDEIHDVVNFLSRVAPQFVEELITLPTKDEQQAMASPGGGAAKDEMYEQAVEIILREGRGSVSLLQRALGIGYGRAARLIDFMAEDGLVGPYNGSQAREVLMTYDQWLSSRQSAQSAAGPPKPRNRLVLKAPAAAPLPKPAGKAAPNAGGHADADDDADEQEYDGEEYSEDEAYDEYDEESYSDEDASADAAEDEADDYDDGEYEDDDSEDYDDDVDSDDDGGSRSLFGKVRTRRR